MADGGQGPYALRARGLEPRWSNDLIAELLGMRLEEEEEGSGGGGGGQEGGRGGEGGGGGEGVLPPPPPGRARVARSAGGEEATIEVASLRTLQLALMRDGLEVPFTHQYRHYSLEPLPPNAHALSAAHIPGIDPPLSMQLSCLPAKELERRLKEVRAAGDGAAIVPPAAKRARGGTPQRSCKLTRQMDVVTCLVDALGGSRPCRRYLGAPLPGAAQVERLLEALRQFEGWPGQAAQRKGVAAGNYLTLKRKDIDRQTAWLESRGPGKGGKESVAEAEAAAAVAEAEKELWRLSAAVLEAAAPEAVFDNLAITKGFRGSPHIDHRDVTHQYVVALGDFEGGELCAEEWPVAVRAGGGGAGGAGGGGGGESRGGGCDGRGSVEVDEEGGRSGSGTVCIDIRYRVGRIDGRGVHWVRGWRGERYSVVFFSLNPQHATPVAPTREHVRWMEGRCAAAASAGP